MRRNSPPAGSMSIFVGMIYRRWATLNPGACSVFWKLASAMHWNGHAGEGARATRVKPKVVVLVSYEDHELVSRDTSLHSVRCGRGDRGVARFATAEGNCLQRGGETDCRSDPRAARVGGRRARGDYKGSGGEDSQLAGNRE